jgi:hypothetical protein
MASAENLAAIRARGHHWLVAGHQSERADYLEQFEEEEGWQENVVRAKLPP